MPLQQTSGNVTQDAYGGGAASVPVYVENVFSTYLYTGTASTQSITNNIPLSTKGGMVWIKDRQDAYWHLLYDTVRGAGYYVSSNSSVTNSGYDSTSLTSFNTNGFSLGVGSTSPSYVNTGANYVSWSFAKQANFFDIQTWTGNGASSRAINHNLGCTPGCIMVFRTDSTGNSPVVYHKGVNAGSSPQNYDVVLNNSAAAYADSTQWNNTAPTSTQFTVGSASNVNASGGSYIAYIFGPGGTGGFGLTGTQDIISCGYYTGTGSAGLAVNLGFEPQWVLVRRTDIGNSWVLQDNMRGMSITVNKNLIPNVPNAESAGNNSITPTSTGFTLSATSASWNAGGGNYIYIAICRGPMATPTTGTSVFAPVVQNPSGTTTVTTGFPVDLTINAENSKTSNNNTMAEDRLRGDSTSNLVLLRTQSTAAEYTLSSYGFGFDNETAIIDNYLNSSQGVTDNVTYWNFARAPGFFDIVCYTGTGNTTTLNVNHNLNAVPQLMFIKWRSGAGLSLTNWAVYSNTLGNGNALWLNANNASFSNIYLFANTNPTSTQFTVGQTNTTNASGANYVAYLFASVTGVSYVGSYTGTGSTQSIACGFGASGARFILAKATSTTGDWYVFDSANGLTSSSSPYLTLDTTNAQVTGNNGVYASSGGFTLTSNASSTVNVNGVSYIFLAVS
jgi:hypothetical protein